MGTWPSWSCVTVQFQSEILQSRTNVVNSEFVGAIGVIIARYVQFRGRATAVAASNNAGFPDPMFVKQLI